MRAKITRIEYSLPKKSEGLEELKEEKPEWDLDRLLEKTGIRTRHISELDQTASDLAFEAAVKVLSAGPDIAEIDALIFVSQSPDYHLPTTACILQDRLGLSQRCLAFDINQGCSGFVIGLGVAASLIDSGNCSKILILTADTYTKYINADDRTCRPIFSDGAAATLVESENTHCISTLEYGSDGSGHEKLIVRTGGARALGCKSLTGRPLLEMKGSDVFLFTMNVVPQCIRELLRKHRKKLSDVDHFIFHQASRLVIENLVRTMNLPPEKVFNGLHDTGNTVSASIPIALKQADQMEIFKDGDVVLIAGFGVGLSWAASLLTWKAI